MGKHTRSASLVEIKDYIAPAIRNRIYPVTLAVLALLAGYGYMADDKTALWIAVVNAAFGLGVATSHRPKPVGEYPNLELEER